MVHLDDAATQRSNQRFVRASLRAPLLSREREQDVALRWRDRHDTVALHELVGAYTRLVVSTAARFRHYGLPSGDLVQEGSVGLLQAASRFDPERDVRFSTYAMWWIRAAMQDYVLRNWSIVRTGTTAAHKTLFFSLRRMRARIEANGGTLGDAGRRQIADELGVDLSDVEAMEQRLAGADQSLNAPLSLDGDEARQDFLLDERPTPEEAVIERRDGMVRSRWLREAMAELDARERIIIRERRMRDDGLTLAELGQELGISKERVRQIEVRALLKLRHGLSRRGAAARDL